MEHVKNNTMTSSEMTSKKPTGVYLDTCPVCGSYNEKWVKRRVSISEKETIYCWHCGYAVEIEPEE